MIGRGQPLAHPSAPFIAVPTTAGTGSEATRNAVLGSSEHRVKASLLGGMALSNAGLGAVHGFAAPVGGMFPAPHGAVCAALLPHAIDVNIRALREREPRGLALPRYEEVARMLTRRPQARAEDAAAWTAQICRKLEIQPLRAYGVGDAHIEELVE